MRFVYKKLLAATTVLFLLFLGYSFPFHVKSSQQTDNFILIEDKDYGTVKAASFSHSWLSDYPLIVEHAESEHTLHVKGKDENEIGLTWHTEKFETDMDERFSPEATIGRNKRGGVQMKLAYFLVPEKKMRILRASGLSTNVLREVEVEKDGNKYYRFFVHPLAYEHFRSLHNDREILFVGQEQSDLMGTPSSSYRSWVVRSVEQAKNGTWIAKENSTPFVLKLGVPGSILGFERWLKPGEIERSLYAQMALDDMPSNVFLKSETGSDNFYIFPENMGLMLQNIQGYPPKVDQADEVIRESGLIIREFPPEMLNGQSHILSFAALMSPERVKPENNGIGSPFEAQNTADLPLIYEVIEATVRAGLVENSYEFIEKYLLEAYLSSIEDILFKEGFRPEPHSQNLLLVLNPNFTPKGFAYRDFGGFWIDVATRGLEDKDVSIFQRTIGESHTIFRNKGAITKAYIASYSWFYRYQIVIKLLNLLTKTEDLQEYIPPPLGAPYQIGQSVRLQERILYPYLVKHVSPDARKIIDKHSLTLDEYHQILAKLDAAFLKLLDKYFDLDRVGIEYVDGVLPSAEYGSVGEALLSRHKGFLGKHRFQKLSPDQIKVPMAKLPKDVLARAEVQGITSFEKLPFGDAGATSFLIENRGLCFLNEKEEIVAFLPYCYDEERAVIIEACQ